MTRLISPHLLSLVWGLFASLKAYAYSSHNFPSFAAFQDNFPLEFPPLWTLWAITAILCFIGAIPWGKSQGISRHLRIMGITSVAFLLALKAFIYWTGITDTSWVTGVNYFMLAMSALVTAVFIGRLHTPSVIEQVVNTPDMSGGDYGFDGGYARD